MSGFAKSSIERCKIGRGSVPMAASASGAKVEKTFSSPSRYREIVPSQW